MQHILLLHQIYIFRTLYSQYLSGVSRDRTAQSLRVRTSAGFAMRNRLVLLPIESVLTVVAVSSGGVVTAADTDAATPPSRQQVEFFVESAPVRMQVTVTRCVSTKIHLSTLISIFSSNIIYRAHGTRPRNSLWLLRSGESYKYEGFSSERRTPVLT